MQSSLVTVIKVLAIVAVIVTAYAWVAADDWEAELMEEQRLSELAQERQQANLALSLEPEFEPDWNSVQAPVPVINQAQRAVKKSAVRAKRHIKSRK